MTMPLNFTQTSHIDLAFTRLLYTDLTDNLSCRLCKADKCVEQFGDPELTIFHTLASVLVPIPSSVQVISSRLAR